MKVKMKSGEKDFKFSHLAAYKLKQNTGKTALKLYLEFMESDLDLTLMYELLFAGITGYNTIEEMLEDMFEDKKNVLEYGKVVADGLGKHFGAMTQNTNQEQEK